jgi:hypothetical protein
MDVTRPRVLLGWDIGDGISHVRRLARAAAALRGAGWFTVLALRDLHRLSEEAALSADLVIPAPGPRLIVSHAERLTASGYGDIAGVCGFADPDALLTLTRAWDAVIALARPDVVVADFSPVLALACHGRHPMLALGDGFVVPPVDADRLPILRPNVTPFASEERLLECAARVQKARAAAPVESLPRLIGGQDQLLCVLPELDVYGRQRKRLADGPFETLPSLLPSPERPGVFAYLAGDHPQTEIMLRMLGSCGLPVSGYVRDVPAAWAAAALASGLTLHDRPPPLDAVLAPAALVVHHGGIGTAQAALAAGRPQLIVPRHLEHAANARRVAGLGAGLALPHRFNVEEARHALDTVVGTATYAEAARKAAARIGAAGRRPSLDLLVERVQQIAGRANGPSRSSEPARHAHAHAR